ncbi:MAG: hypothetical protein P8H88_04745, partial [Flavobacteriales bacterium]|nr:hypothetical protein [Flavobacteriales bacterium]
PFDTHFSPWEDRIYRAAWRRDFWLAEMRRSSDTLSVQSELEASARELSEWEGKPFEWEWKYASEVEWDKVKQRYNTHYGEAFAARNQMRGQIASSQDLVVLKNTSHNDELWEWVLQDDRKDRAAMIGGDLVQKSGPIHRYNDGTLGRHATMYMPFKTFGPLTLTTLAYNVFALLAMSACLWLLLLATPWLKEKAWRRLSRQTSSPQV